MRSFLASLALTAAVAAHAVNPIVQTCYTTDPAPMVKGDTLYVFTGHDEAGADFFWMQEWRVYSTTDMVNWTDHGSPLAIEDFSWGDDRAWAPQCVERDGKYYLYIPLHSSVSGTMAIGVAVADSPTGPYKDALGHPLADGSWDFIDPTCFVNDDGQAWLFWGNPTIYYVKLNPDMISYEGEVKTIVPDEAGFGPGKEVPMEPGKKYRSSYTEGPWFFKRGGNYYLLYAAGGIPEHIAYSMAPSPEGPWRYMGTIMPQMDETRSFTNHCGVADYKGRSYFFYHTGRLPGGGGFGRSMCVEEFKYNPDGTFPVILPTDEGAAPIATFNPYRRVEAETMAWSRGVSTEPNSKTGVYLSDIHNGDYVMLRNVDFRSGGPRIFGAMVASAKRGGEIEVRMDAEDGPVVATLTVPGTGGWEEWQWVEAPAQLEIPGVHDIYLTFKGRKGPKLFNIDYWEFK